MAGRISPVRAVTLSVLDLDAARRLYQDLLGMRPRAEWEWDAAEEPGPGRLWGVSGVTGARCLWLEQPGATAGAIRLVEFRPASRTTASDGARPYDYGLVKNLDFFSDDVQGAFDRLSAAGVRFPAPPVRYPVPWGGELFAQEAHSEAFEGVKLSIARLEGAPRKAFGEASHESPFTEVAVAAHVVADHPRAERFYCDAFDCVPAAATVLDDPALVAALRLPPRTRLRVSFIGPAAAVAGKIGLIAYEGPGVADARSLSEQARPPHRGAVMLSFETDDLDGRHGLALLSGASELHPPLELEMPPFGRVRAASLRSPDGITIELLEPLPAAAPELLRVCDAAAVPPGRMLGALVPGLGRVVVANVGEQLFALEDRCPHLGGPLSKGAFDGRRITCPWHGWTIDAATGRARGALGQAARCHALRVRDGSVWVRRL